MYLDLDANDNLPAPAMATFKETAPGRRIAAVRLERDGAWAWCAITGWDAGAVPAWSTPIEESGDGPARLLHGGGQGLRLAAIAAPAAAATVRWDVHDPAQWGEPFLIIRPEAEVVLVADGQG
jgi:hypothetical protein